MVMIVLVFSTLVAILVLMNACRHDDDESCTIQKKFSRLGDPKGKTKGQIHDVMGKPTHIYYFVDCQSLSQWRTKSYHLVLHFEGEICGGITHESKLTWSRCGERTAAVDAIGVALED